MFEVDFSDGTCLAKTASLSAYNKAYIYGNQNPPDGIGSLGCGKSSVEGVSTQVRTTNHTILPAAGQLTRLKADILADMPTATVFYCWTHGINGFFGDSSAQYDNNLQPYMSVKDITTAIAAKKPAQPPNLPQYNFVFLNTCHCGESSLLSNAFAAGTFLAWSGIVADTPHNVNWANRVFTKLAAGWDLTDAIGWASIINNGGPELDVLGNAVTPMLSGDILYKLHGLYGVPRSLAWH